MTLLIITVIAVLAVSCCCSLAEAALYAVRMPYIQGLVDQGRREGRLLSHFKEHMERPIAAILILNTIANTSGSSLAGAQAAEQLGHHWIGWFSAAFTLAVLVLSEIVPKVAGVIYSRGIACVAARPLSWLIAALSPVIWLLERLTQFLRPGQPVLQAPKDEVLQFAKLSAAEGSILKLEAELIERVLRLNDVTAGQLMTPKSEVFDLPATATLNDIKDRVSNWPHARVPLRSPDDGRWTGMVIRKDVLTRLAHDEFQVPLSQLSRPLHVVREDTLAHDLLLSFLHRQTYLFAVVDAHDTTLGVVALDDVFEAMLGRAIEDEKPERGASRSME